MKYIGNFSNEIDFDKVIADVEKQTPTIKGLPQKEELKKWVDDEYYNLLITSGYTDLNSVQWDDYVIPEGIEEKLATLLNVKSSGGWITSVLPGHVVPWHYDIEINIPKIPENSKLIRFTCILSKPKFGQLFVLENEVLHLEEQGSIFEWDNWNDWHGGMNMGYERKYLINFLGIRQHEE